MKQNTVKVNKTSETTERATTAARESVNVATESTKNGN